MKQNAAQRGLVWFAPWQNPSGYCSEALAFALALGKKRPLELIDVARFRSPEFVAGLPEAAHRMLKEKLRSNVNIAGKIAVQHLPGSGFAPAPQAAWSVGRTMFETDRLPADWAARCNLLDEIWVPSRFNLETFSAGGVHRDKLRVVPEAVDENLFNPAAHQPLPLPRSGGCNFLAMFEWSARKGWDVLLSSYLREFCADDDVCLYLRVYLTNQPGSASREIIAHRIQQFAGTLGLGAKRWPRIELLDQPIPTRDLPRLYRAVHCLVAPSRGEGWGRPHHEAMMMGLPVIATNWSGNTEFMTAENSYPLDFELVEAADVEPEFAHYRGHRWALASEKHLRELMRRVQQNPAEARARGQQARQHVLRNFSLQPVAQILLTRIEDIENRISTRVHPQAGCVAWEGSFLDHGSLSHVNRELTRALQSNPAFQICRVSNGAPAAAGYEHLAAGISATPPPAAALTVRHAWPPNWKRPHRGKLAVIQPWEFGALPEDWVRQSRNVDEFWVPSHYVRDCYLESGVPAHKVFIVPNGVDAEKFHPQAAPMPLATQKKFRFLFVGGTIHRKGPDLLLAAYLNNFTVSDDVCLVIKDFGGQSVYAGQTFENQIKAAQSQPGAPEILYLNQELPADALPGLYAACHCLVHPYRGEGFGLPVLEAMACGLPVIVTGGGATDDFAGEEQAYRIAARRKSIGAEISGLKLARNGWLLEPDLPALGARMKWVAGHPDEARRKGQAAGEQVRRDWTWQRAAQIAALRLQELLKRRPAAAGLPAQRIPARPTVIALPETAKVGHLGQARVCLGRKEFLQAWQSALAALARRPFHCEAWLLLAEIARATGDMAQARLCAGHAQALAPNWQPARQFTRALPARAGQPRTWPGLPESPAAPRLTVCLITRNEEQFLGRCLQSIQGLAHQIVVVDTGSTDRTVEIARDHGAEVHHFAWCDDFAAARNAALEHATGDWVLSLDADEELSPEHRQTILQEMQATGVMGYRLPILNEGRETEGCSYVPRLFRNAPGLFYVGRVHEQVFSSIEVRCEEWGLKHILGKSLILHHGYVKEVMESRGKIARNLRLLERANQELPGEPNLVMNLGLELARSGQLEAGLEKYYEALHLMAAQPPGQIVPELRETLLTQLTTHLLAARNHAGVAELWAMPFAKSAGLTASNHFGLGLAYMELQRPAEAAEQMRQCLAKRGQPVLSPVNVEILKAGPNHCLALCLWALGQNEAAAQAFAAALAGEPSSLRAGIDFARFQAGQGRPLEALKQLNSLAAGNPGEAPVWELGGQIALSRPEFMEFARDWTGEAVKHFPEHPGLLAQRAEALLLTQDAAGALPLWRAAPSPASSRQMAAVVLCELLTGGCDRQFPPDEEASVSRELVRWYRQLIAAGAHSSVCQLHERMEQARQVAPGFVRVWEAATQQARQKMVPA